MSGECHATLTARLLTPIRGAGFNKKIMREIKFRVWDKVNKKFIVPAGLVISPDGSVSNVRYGEGFISELPYLTSDEFIIEQFTGLKDRNGKEIYEGDILGGVEVKPFKKPPKGLRCIVQWKEATPFPSFELKDNKKDGEYLLAKFNTGHWEIIGNIHENSDMLKKE